MKQLMAATGRIKQDFDETLEALAAVRNRRHKDPEERSRRVTLYARDMAKRLDFSPDHFKRLESVVETPSWSRLHEPER